MTNAGISISDSFSNQIYNNIVRDIKNGIEIKANSYDNIVQNNKIRVALEPWGKNIWKHNREYLGFKYRSRHP